MDSSCVPPPHFFPPLPTAHRADLSLDFLQAPKLSPKTPASTTTTSAIEASSPSSSASTPAPPATPPLLPLTLQHLTNRPNPPLAPSTVTSLAHYAKATKRRQRTLLTRRRRVRWCRGGRLMALLRSRRARSRVRGSWRCRAVELIGRMTMRSSARGELWTELSEVDES